MARGAQLGAGEKPPSGRASDQHKLDATQRGWRFFEWKDLTAVAEEQLSVEHPSAHLIAVIEAQVAERLQIAGVEPLADIDVCFYHDRKEHDRTGKGEYVTGSVVINVDKRIQIMLWINQDNALVETGDFIQTVCHEYCHALFVRASLRANSSDGQMNFSVASQKRADEVLHNDVVAGEALADAFVMLVHRQVTFYSQDADNFLHYQQIEVSKEYKDAYSLKRILASLASATDAKQDNFLYIALRLHEQRPELSLFDCLRLGVEQDHIANPEGQHFAVLYERIYQGQLDGYVAAPVPEEH